MGPDFAVIRMKSRSGKSKINKKQTWQDQGQWKLDLAQFCSNFGYSCSIWNCVHWKDTSSFMLFHHQLSILIQCHVTGTSWRDWLSEYYSPTTYKLLQDLYYITSFKNCISYLLVFRYIKISFYVNISNCNIFNLVGQSKWFDHLKSYFLDSKLNKLQTKHKMHKKKTKQKKETLQRI